MSYSLDFVVGQVPKDSKEAWAYLEELREAYYDDEEPRADVFDKLHEVLTSRYPCLCSYADDDPEMDKSPWSDGPLINNFCSQMGMVAISFRRVDEVVPFAIKSALALGITVMDGQDMKIHRP